ncbi:MAG: TonB-dependent receptor [Gammaproteobacteria bacterium]|nr:TonB-dependent receptor [Gammaproteobacteria bacterium]
MTNKQSGNGQNLVRLSVAVALGSAMLLSYVPQAISAEEAKAVNDLEEVQVTGTRIKRATDFDTANPTTVVDGDYFKNMGIVNVGDAMKSLPSNISNFSPTTTGNSNFFAGSTIANLRGLNPFFGSRTLNLVNGRRHVPTNQGDGVDLNFIPSILIERMDVVTGGASAAYGSGAISGVNNVFLNRKLEGIKVEADWGQSIHSDGRDAHYAGAFGTGFANDRGHVSFAAEHQSLDALGCIEVRDWCAKNANVITNPAAGAYSATLGGWAFNGALVTASNPHPANIMAYNVRSPFTPAGVIAGPFTGPLAQVNTSGTALMPFQSGVGSTVFYPAVSGGEGRPAYYYTNLRSPVDRNVFTGTLSFKVTDTVNLTADASWGEVTTDQRTGALDDGGFFGKGIRNDNAFLLSNPALNAQVQPLLLNNFFSFPVQLNKDWTSQLDSHSAFNTKVRRISAGLDGRFGETSWTWDTYVQYGKSERTQLVQDNRHLNAYDFAADAVFDNRDAALPVNQRRIECRITQQIRTGAATVTSMGQNLYNIAQGCLPINVFGTAPLDPKAKAYAFGFLHEATTVEQKVAAFNATGDLFSGFGAGTVQGAAGVEFRNETGSNIGSQDGAPDYVRNDYLIQYGESFAGKVNVIEAYAETNLPLLRDAPLAKRLELDVAGRWSQYKNTGTLGPGNGVKRTHDMFTWKASGFWDPIDGLRIRGSRSRDSRAANFRELYYGQIIQAGGWFGYCTPAGLPPGSTPDACTWSLEGNVDVKPETSDTTTIGFVFTPREIIPGLEFAVDYFHIKITDAIQQANVTRVREGCQISHIQEFCNLITPDPGVNGALPTPGTNGNYSYNPATGQGIQLLRATSFNGSAYNYKGLDISGSYRLDMGDLGGLNFRLLATRMFTQKFSPVPGQAPVNIVGQTGTANSFLNDNNPSAKWNAQLSSTYLKGGFSTTLTAHYVGTGKKNYLGVDPSDGDWYIRAPSNWVRYDDNSIGSYTVFGLNANYRFEGVMGAKSIDLWGNVANLLDRDPPLVGGGSGGTQPIFYDTLGRYYKVGIRASF